MNPKLSKMGLSLLLAISSLCAQAAEKTIVYTMYLYFADGTPYTDELTLSFQGDKITGRMHVPNDFDADISSPAFNSQGELEFHVKLPSKYDVMFPGGLDYQIRFPQTTSCTANSCKRTADREKFVGLVYAPGQRKYVGSLVGFTKTVP